MTPTASTSAASSAASATSGVVPSAAIELLAERHLGHDRQVRRRPRLPDGVEQMAEIGERLEHEQVDPALEQTVDLFPERRSDRGGVVAGQVARRATERADRSGHEDVPSRDVAGLTGELGAAPVQPGRPVREPEAGQPRAVGPERGGLDDVGARPRGTRGGSPR